MDLRRFSLAALGAVALGMPAVVGAQTEIRLTEPEPFTIDSPADSRIGLNISRLDQVEENTLLGIRWVRFENSKWPFVSSAKDTYDFHGSIAPWNVDFDDIIGTYHEAGFGVIPMMFQTPEWAGQKMPHAEKDPKRDSPPINPEDYGDYCFQMAARYGGTKVSADKLLSADKQSGKGWIKYFEIWNEPNLNPARGKGLSTWGFWRASMAEFWPVFRAGAEAVKEADPTAIVTSPGFAGMTPDTVDVLRMHVYPDGKRPVDFCEVINVHFYSGKQPPETAGRDPNTNADLGGVRYEEHLKRLAEWRDEYCPGAEIWMTETGHDTAGEIGISEEMQAARLPRNLMIGFQNGLDRIIIYREKGSTPSKHAAAGLIRNDYSRKPGWYSIATLARQIHLAEPVCQLPIANDNVRAYLWDRQGKPMVTAWTVQGQESFELDFGSASVVDAFGHETMVEQTQGMVVDDFPRYLSDFGNEAALEPLKKEAERLAKERRDAIAALAAKDAYLFDFGQNPEPVSIHLGKMRQLQPVNSGTLYNAEQGYGYEGTPREDGFQHWRKPLQDKYYVAAKGDVPFRFDVEAGRYKMRFFPDSSRAEQRSIIVEVDGQQQSFTVPRNNKEVLEVEFVAKGKQPVRIKSDGEYSLRWIEAVRMD